jgi:hypothetical protein
LKFDISGLFGIIANALLFIGLVPDHLRLESERPRAEFFMIETIDLF